MNFLLKSSLAVLAVSHAVLAMPHRHRDNALSADDQSAVSQSMTDASDNNCPCGTFPTTDANDNPVCVQLQCELTCGPCSDSTDYLDSDDMSDPHHIGVKHKVCRYNNDASCHSCPSSSCQYPLGNYWGSGFPCKNVETKSWLDGDAAQEPTVDENGNGLSFTVTSEYADNVSEVIEFCPTDPFALAQLNCGTDKVEAIVSPKTCTHCQVARCISFHDISRYAHWNPQFFEADGVTYVPEIQAKADFQPIGFWEPHQAGSTIH